MTKALKSFLKEFKNQIKENGLENEAITENHLIQFLDGLKDYLENKRPKTIYPESNENGPSNKKEKTSDSPFFKKYNKKKAQLKNKLNKRSSSMYYKELEDELVKNALSACDALRLELEKNRDLIYNKKEPIEIFGAKIAGIIDTLVRFSNKLNSNENQFFDDIKLLKQFVEGHIPGGRDIEHGLRNFRRYVTDEYSATSTRKLMNKTDSSELLAQYHSIPDILEDPRGPAFAYAEDMSYVDWVNYQVKNFIIRYRFLNQIVTVNIDGEMVKLVNPITGNPLIYGDFITDRSGPKFGGYLYDGLGSEYLDGNVSSETVKQLMEEQKIKTIEYCKANNLAEPRLDDLDQAVSIFNRKQQTQRRLSDFDLTARETSLLERAIIDQVKNRLNENEKARLESMPEFKKAIGKIAWQEGGKINLNIIREYLYAEKPSIKKYADRVHGLMMHPNDPLYKKPSEEGFDPNYAFTHMLIEGVGKTIRKEYQKLYDYLKIEMPTFYYEDSSGVPDTFYGLGIPFFEAPIKSINQDTTTKIELSTHHDDLEIGDIICDNSSIFGHILNPQNIFIAAINQLKGIISEDIINDEFEKIAKETPGGQIRVFEKFLLQIIDHPSLSDRQRIEIKKVQNQFYKNFSFMESSLIFEESAKKESQSQWFKVKLKVDKLVGNISDIGIYAKKLKEKMNSSNETESTDAKAHFQVLLLSTLISFTRWGIDKTNHHLVDRTHENITVDQFRDSLNKRSYTSDPTTGIRKALLLSDISIEVAQVRLNDYEDGFSDIWMLVRENRTYFEIIDEYIKTRAELMKAYSASEAAKDNISVLETKLSVLTDYLRTYLRDMIFKKMPELVQKMKELVMENNLEDTLMDGILDQLFEAIHFGINRKLLDMKRGMQAKARENIDTTSISPQSPYSRESSKTLDHFFKEIQEKSKRDNSNVTSEFTLKK